MHTQDTGQAQIVPHKKDFLSSCELDQIPIRNSRHFFATFLEFLATAACGLSAGGMFAAVKRAPHRRPPLVLRMSVSQHRCLALLLFVSLSYTFRSEVARAVSKNPGSPVMSL